MKLCKTEEWRTIPGYGENHHSVKYSDELVRKIRSEYTGRRGEQSALARKYNVPTRYVSNLVNGTFRK